MTTRVLCGGWVRVPRVRTTDKPGENALSLCLLNQCVEVLHAFFGWNGGTAWDDNDALANGAVPVLHIRRIVGRETDGPRCRHHALCARIELIHRLHRITGQRLHAVLVQRECRRSLGDRDEVSTDEAERLG